MRELNKEELKTISGGAITAALLSAIVKGAETLLEAGRCLGTAIRRIFTKNVCVVS